MGPWPMLGRGGTGLTAPGPIGGPPGLIAPGPGGIGRIRGPGPPGRGPPFPRIAGIEPLILTGPGPIGIFWPGGGPGGAAKAPPAAKSSSVSAAADLFRNLIFTPPHLSEIAVVYDWPQQK